MSKQTETNAATQLILGFFLKKGIYAKRHGVSAGSADYTNKAGDTKTRYFQSGIPGGSDIFAFVPPHGSFLGVEIKKGSDRLRPEQIGFIKNIQHVGGAVITAHGDTAQEIFGSFKSQFDIYEAAQRVFNN